jgi:O-antigen ligase
MSEGQTHAVPARPDLHPTPWRQLVALLRTDIFVLAMFLSLMLIGGDRFAIQLAGLSLRVVFPLLMLALGMLYMLRATAITFPAGLGALFFLFAIAGAISTLNSMVVVKSVGYTIWVFFNFFVIIMLCFNLARLYAPQKILSLWFLIFRVHVFLVIGQLAFGLAHGHLERPTLWFYEASYMAIFLSAYFGSALYMFLRIGRAYALDLALATFVLLLTASATGLFGMVFAIFFNFLIARQRLKLLLWAVGLGAAFVSILYIFFGDSPYFQLMVGFVLQGDNALDIVLDRAGNRWVRVLIGWNAFLHNPWTGIGIGSDTAYMDATPLPDFSQRYIHPWTDISGQPFCNIFVEVLGTMGIVGFIPFCGILGYCIWQAFRLQRDSHPMAPIAMAFLMGFFCSILTMQLEGTMLRYYLWSPLGLAFGVIAQLRSQAPLPSPDARKPEPAVS